MRSCERCNRNDAPYVLSDEFNGIVYSEVFLCRECLKRIVLGRSPDEPTEAILEEILERYRP
jgi:hypothetical protein